MDTSADTAYKSENIIIHYCEALTTHFQGQVPAIIDPDQSAFIRGRSIAENFVYATEVVQCCHRRRAPTIILKLDFAKAFDPISWSSLRAVVEVWGFPTWWCRWMDSIF